MEDAAKRETLEEAGVTGKVEVSIFKSISDSISFCNLFPSFCSDSIFFVGFNFTEEIGRVAL